MECYTEGRLWRTLKSRGQCLNFTQEAIGNQDMFFFVVIVSLFSFLAAAFFMAVRMLLSSSLALGTKVCPHPFLDKFLGPLVLRDLEQQHDTLLIRMDLI